MEIPFCANETVAVVTSPNSATATVPPFPGAFDTEDCVDAGGCDGTHEVITACDVTITNLFTGCSDTRAGGFFYLPFFDYDSDGDGINDETMCQVDPPSCSFSVTPAAPTAGNPVIFTDTSSGCVTSWNWDFGDGGTDTVANPAHTEAAAGTYIVTRPAGNSGGTSTGSQTVTVAP